MVITRKIIIIIIIIIFLVAAVVPRVCFSLNSNAASVTQRPLNEEFQL